MIKEASSGSFHSPLLRSSLGLGQDDKGLVACVTWESLVGIRRGYRETAAEPIPRLPVPTRENRACREPFATRLGRTTIVLCATARDGRSSGQHLAISN